MIYLHVTVQLERGKMDEWARIFENNILPLQEKHGQRLVGAWKTSIGPYDEVTDLYAFEDLTHFQKTREKLFADPEMQKWLPIIWGIAGEEVSKVLVPLGYGELK